MISKLSVLLVCALAILSPFGVAKLQETMRVTIYNLDFQASVAEVKKILKKADLEGHGFSKEVSFKLVKGSGRDKPEYQESHFYYKVVNCSRILEIEQELDTLLHGVLGQEVNNKLHKEIKARHLEDMGQCRVGLVHVFRKTGGHYDSKYGSMQLKERRNLNFDDNSTKTSSILSIQVEKTETTTKTTEKTTSPDGNTSTIETETKSTSYKGKVIFRG